MTTYRVDLLSGARTYELDLAQLPFRSRLGANDGTMEITCDGAGRITKVTVAFNAPKRFLVDELDRIAQEASWPIPIDEIRRAPALSLRVDMQLKPQYLEELETLDLDDPHLEVKASWYPDLMDDHHYTVENLKVVEAPQ